MTRIDLAILDLTERFCRRFQVVTGRTNIWLAVQLTNLSIIVYFVWAAAFSLSMPLWPRLALGLFCGGLFYVLTQTLFKVSIETYENNAFRRVAKGLRNPRRLRDAPLRISFLTLCLVLFYPVLFAYGTLGIRIAPLSYSLILLTTVVLYLLACDPLAPCAGVLKEWLRGSARSRVPAPESSRVTTAFEQPGIVLSDGERRSVAAVLDTRVHVRRDRDRGRKSTMRFVKEVPHARETENRAMSVVR
jgi:hypothetical protein